MLGFAGQQDPINSVERLNARGVGSLLVQAHGAEDSRRILGDPLVQISDLTDSAVGDHPVSAGAKQAVQSASTEEDNHQQRHEDGEQLFIMLSEELHHDDVSPCLAKGCEINGSLAQI